MRKFYPALILLAFFVFCTHAKAQVVINEIVTSNTSLNVDEDGDYQDWVELYNNGPSSVNLNGYGLTDDPALPFKWTFPNVTLNSGAYLLIYCSDKNRAVVGQPLHTNWKISSSGENVVLTSAASVTVDQVPATAIEQNFSFGRFPNGTGPFVFFEDVTPNAQNAATGYNDILASPVFSQAGGFFASAFNLTLSSPDPGVTLLYTLDGSEPDPANIGGHTYQYRNVYNETGSQLPGPLLSQSYATLTYSSPINIHDRSSEPNKISMISSTYHNDPSFYLPDGNIFKGTVVRVKAIKPGALASPTVSQTYFVTPEGAARYDIPVISLSVTESEFFDYNDGIYVAGKDFDDWRAQNPTTYPQGLEVGNYYRRGIENEKRANMTYFVNGTQVLNQDVGLRIRGASTRRYESKALTVYARSDYGDDDLDYPFFSDLPYQSYERLTLSNSGSDFRNTMFRDALCHEICYDFPIENENYQPAVTFVNGEYWGILNIRERIDDKYFGQVYGTEDVDLLENQGEEAEEGTPDDYQQLVAYMNSHNLSNQANYDYVVTQLDPASFADYYISQIFLDNSDWPGNNTMFWRYRTDTYDPTAPYGLDGRYRWVFHDLDDTFSFGTDDFNHNNLAVATTLSSDWPNPEWSTLFLRKMLQNPTFKNYFINRFADLMNSYFLPQTVISKLNAMAAGIDSEMPEHILRWNSPHEMDSWEYFLDYERDFATQRPGFQRNHIRQKFNIASNITATLNVSNIDHGYIKINTLELKPGLPGISATPFPWNGIYFSNIPVSLTAIAKPGYVFSHWTGVSTATTPEITVTSATSFNATAVFIPEGFAVEESVPVYFWMMNTAIPNDTPLTALNSSYEVLPNTTIAYSSSLAGYPYTSSDPLWRHGSMERRNAPTPVNYRTEANGNLPYAPGIMRGLQITQPFQNAGLENTMVFNLPTNGYKEVKFSFAAMDEGAATGIVLDYSVSSGAPNWISTGIASALSLTTGSYQLYGTDFSTITSVNDNPNFKVRLRFTGPNMTADTGARVTFNNIAMDAVKMPLTYPSPNTFTVGTAIAPLTPSVTATATSYSISTPLPAGLSFDTATGTISGTPTAVSATSTYTVTASNAGGSTAFDLVITVNPAAPSALSYSTPNVFTVGSAIAALSPTVTGSVSAYSVSPSLPAGLSFDTATGTISGTPTAVSATSTYTVTASNAGGSTTFNLVITVNPAAPSALSYSTPNVFTVGSAIAALSPTVTGSVSAYSVSPALPAGLSFDTATGTISGTPTAVSATATYTVTASNAGGSTTFDLMITVNPAAPSALGYSTPNVFTVGSAIAALSPTVTGSVAAYSVSPLLPAGLSFDTATGTISGTPTAVSATSTYTVTASNAGGSTTFDLVITVNPAAPSALSYSTPNVFTVGSAIAALSPTVTGSVSAYSVSPALPAGLSFDTATGTISGTPTAVSATSTYTVTASNAGGSTTFNLVITVNPAAPGSLSYTSPNIFTVGTTIAPLFPAIVGFVTGFSASPALPAGLSIDPIFGIISGTPTVVTATATYTITAFNLSGTSTFTITITVNDVAPSALSYPTPNVFTVGNAIANLSPTVTGNVVSYSISPSLSAGLSFNTATGVISGTPTSASAQNTYTVTATNTGGSVSFGVVITVNSAAPSALSYTTPNVFTVGTAISPLTPTVSGDVSSYSISPSLPAGLSFNTATGVISGTPTSASAQNTYTVTATNTGGSVSFGVQITVNDAAPGSLSYTSPNVYTVGTAISPLFPAIVGFVSGFSVSPALPDGLTLDSDFGIISGTPTSVAATATYTVTASNSGGSVSFGVVITVNPMAPAGLSYASPNVYTVGSAISGLTPTVTGTVTTFSAPVLPAGLSIDASTGVISGTPTVSSPQATYTVTASNAGGSTSFGIVITVNSVAPSALSYSTPNVFTVGTAISPSTPTVSGDVSSYSISPALPAGLSFNTTTGVISGTPTTASAQNTYTVTATNSGGSTAFGVQITVNEAAPSSLSYATPNVFLAGTAITPLTPVVTGSVTSYSISPELPAGLSFNTATGVISGTPTVASAFSVYTVTATNASGSTTFDIEIMVFSSAPTGLSYTTPNVFTVGSAIAALSPSVSGNVDTYTVSPALPAGLSLDAVTGIITGTPTVVTATSSYTVTATNAGGSVTFDVVITVNDAAPSNLSYPTPLVFTQNQAIATVSATVTGNVTTFSISGTLPAGLTFDPTTGAISGTPTEIMAATTYTITATNSGGSTTFAITITVEQEMGVGEHQALEFSVYPNPFVDYVNVKGLEGDATFSLFSIDGKLLQNGRVENSAVRLRDLPQGVFMLQIVSDGRVGFRKIVRK